MNDLIKVKYEETSNFVTKKNNIKKKKNREKMDIGMTLTDAPRSSMAFSNLLFPIMQGI